MTGQEYCTEVMNSLCNTVIETEDAVAFTAVLRELKMPPTTANRYVSELTFCTFLNRSCLLTLGLLKNCVP